MDQEKRWKHLGGVLWACIVIACWATVESQAATLWVAKDGTGDFEIVADAVEAAASGDTIRIRAGVYPETREYQFDGGLLGVIGRVDVAELTIIGDGAEHVILGPDLPAVNVSQGPTGIVAMYQLNQKLTVRGISLRNLSSGLEARGHDFEIEDCRISGTYFGLRINVTGFATVRRCEFRNTLDAGVMMFRSLNAQGGLVEECTFIECRIGVDLQPRNTQLRDCTFVDGGIGAQVSFGGDCLVERCTFDNLWNVGLGITDGAQVRLFDSEFTGESSVNIGVSGLLEGSGNLLSGAWGAAMRIFYPSTVRFHGNHILNGGGPTILADGGTPPLRTHDLTGNYWGTSDPAQVSAWIVDWYDTPEERFAKVSFEPMAEQPISTESTSFGELKVRFGQE